MTVSLPEMLRAHKANRADPVDRPRNWKALSTTLYAPSGVASGVYIIGVVNEPGHVLRRVTVASPIVVGVDGTNGYRLQVRTYTQDKSGTAVSLDHGTKFDTTLRGLKGLEVKQIHQDKMINFPCPKGTVIAVSVTHVGTPASTTLLTHPSFQAELYYRGA